MSDQYHRRARLVSWLMLGLTVLAFAGAVVLQGIGRGALTGELARVVQETLQPEHVSVWLRGSKRL